jgi:hypothetical protein
MLQAGRSRVRFQMWSLDSSVDLILLAILRPWGSTQPLTGMSTRNFPGGKGGRRVRLTTLQASVSLENVGAWTSHNPMGLHGLLQG